MLQKPPFANDGSTRANGGDVQVALGETRQLMSRPRFWQIISAGIVIAVLAGPFHTMERFTLFGRLLYWAPIVIASGLIMTVLSITLGRSTRRNNRHWLTGALLACALGVTPITGLVHLANTLASDDAVGFWPLLGYVGGPVLVVTVLVNALTVEKHHRPARVGPDGAASQTPPLLIAKLPAPLGRDIVALQAMNHYIEVTTTRGKALILMRLGDAERDLAGLNGIRVHRSWWVNMTYVEAIEKSANGPTLRLRTGQMIPIARGKRDAVRDTLRATVRDTAGTAQALRRRNCAHPGSRKNRARPAAPIPAAPETPRRAGRCPAHPRAA